MHGVDVANQLRSNYSCQVRTHKWWHRIFYFFFGHVDGQYVLDVLVLEELPFWHSTNGTSTIPQGYDIRISW
jgi:hypothetical protein